jgi:nanoRNase/pAp phosphatase (c-di-AMP/oligoRNAs hydrolase)
MPKKFRLITRSDFDGLVCAAILKEIDLIDDILFVHPKDMQDGRIAVKDTDITTNLPYVADAHLSFDHHLSETIRNKDIKKNHIIDPKAPSAARVVYNYYGGKAKLPRITDDIMEAVDKADSAQFSQEDILNPDGWVLLNFLMDSRTGLGRFREFTISNYDLMMKLIDYCRGGHNIKQVLELPDVKERVKLYREQEVRFKEQLKRCTKVEKKVAIVDLRREREVCAGNRFMVYALFPETQISMHVMWGARMMNTVLALGKSILNRGSKVNIGELMLVYGGGGHENAGTCQVPSEDADRVIYEILKKI